MSCRAVLGGISVGEGQPVAVIGVLNVSPESFYRGSVHADPKDLLGAAERMVEAGATIVEVGAMSTAPYLRTRISAAEEAERLAPAVNLLVGKLSVPVAADTHRAVPVKAALEAGATIINDVSGLTADPEVARLVALAGAGLILMASPRGRRVPSEPSASPVSIVAALLGESLGLARSAAIAEEKIAVDPGVGFFRESGRPWFEWDCEILARLGELRSLRRPICIGVSRKSFIGALLGQDEPGERLAGSLAATAVAVAMGAHLIRTHDVADTSHAVRIAQAIGRHRA